MIDKFLQLVALVSVFVMLTAVCSFPLLLVLAALQALGLTSSEVDFAVIALGGGYATAFAWSAWLVLGGVTGEVR